MEGRRMDSAFCSYLASPALFPELRTAISKTLPNNLFLGLFVTLIVVGGWVAMDWIVASYLNTQVTQL